MFVVGCYYCFANKKNKTLARSISSSIKNQYHVLLRPRIWYGSVKLSFWVFTMYCFQKITWVPLNLQDLPFHFKHFGFDIIYQTMLKREKTFISCHNMSTKVKFVVYCNYVVKCFFFIIIIQIFGKFIKSQTWNQILIQWFYMN